MVDAEQRGSRHQRVWLSQGSGPRPACDLGACRTDVQHQPIHRFRNLAAGAPAITERIFWPINNLSNWRRWQVRLQGGSTPASPQCMRRRNSIASASITSCALYGIGLLPSRPRDMLSLVVSRNVFSHYLVDAALQQRPTRAYRQFFDNRSVYGAHCAWYSGRHRARVHRSSHAGDLYAADRECSQYLGQRDHVLVERRSSSS